MAHKITTGFVDIIQGGISTLQGSWVHPDLAIQIAQWISPCFAIKVSQWTRQLLLTGTVNLNEQKTEMELLELQKE